MSRADHAAAPSRREFLTATTAATGALALGATSACAPDAPAPPAGAPAQGASPEDMVTPADQPLRVLVLGGTGFIGPHMVRHALARGHTVTMFNRGRTNTHLFPEVEKLVGDRDGDLGALEGRTWDVVLDNSGYVPRHVRDSAQLLSDATDHYMFTSTAGVYASWYDEGGIMKSEPGPPDWPAGGTTEDHPVVALPEPGSEDVSSWYGHLKVLCEDAVREAYGDRCSVTRPGLIVGPGDNTDRFTYYPVRIDRGGDVAAFGAPDDPVQYIDARDLAAWSVKLAEDRTSGTFNAVAPLGGSTMGELLYGIRAITTAPMRFTWVPGSFLAEQGVAEFTLPPWTSQDGPLAGATSFRADRAFAAGLTARPLADTALDTLQWWKSLPAERTQEMRAGLRGGDMEFGPASMDAQMAFEAQILAAWRAAAG